LFQTFEMYFRFEQNMRFNVSYSLNDVLKRLLTFYYRRNATLAQILAVVVCPSVCPSVTRRYFLETGAWIELFFGIQVSLDLCYAVF